MKRVQSAVLVAAAFVVGVAAAVGLFSGARIDARGKGADAMTPSKTVKPPLDARAPAVTETATFALG